MNTTQQTENLKSATYAYWDCAGNLDERLKKYISEKQRELDNKSLLQAELDHARALSNLSATTCHTLVMLVGFSLEPLLQSVCVYNPQKIVLLLNNDKYGDEEWHVFATHITKAIQLLHEHGLIPNQPSYNQTPHPHNKSKNLLGCSTPDTPEGVFQTLIEKLEGENDFVIDITGGKKSMISGAFMYAAYTVARISYVDFSEYHPDKRRPYGYSCKIGKLKNPYKKFALREWERVRALYQNYQFREALKTVRELKETMTNVFSDAQKPIEQLIAFLEYYAVWDSGNYQEAKNLANSLEKFTQPTAVTALGDNWPDRKHFYVDTNLKFYVCDEWARIGRLITMNEDYRSAFLRAGGLNEIVMLARLVALDVKSGDKSALLTALDEKTPSASKVFKALIESSGRDINIGKGQKNIDIFFDGITELVFFEHPNGMQSWWTTTKHFGKDRGWDDFLNKRNDLAHKYFPVTRDLAEDALAFVTANIKDFYCQSVTNLGVHTSAMPWRELCEKTGLSQFLPPNLRQEAQT